jgi:DNA-binding response OmpR family regulator
MQAQRSPAPSEGGPIVLFVEDDPDTRYVVQARLVAAFADIRVVAAESAEAAMELAARLQPTAVVLDLGLRGMDGFDFARRVRALSPSVAIVALTGDTRPETRARATCEGFAAFLIKPNGLEELVAVLRRFLEPQARGHDAVS